MLSHSLLSVRELPTFFSWSPLLAEQRSIDWWLGIETSLRVVGLKALGSYFEHKTTLSVSTSVRHYSLLLPAFFCPEKKKENVNTASEQADNKNCFGSSFPQWSPLYSSLFFSANTSVFGGVVSFREPLLAERVTLKLSSLDRELWGLTWEAWDLLLCWQEQGGGSAQIRSSADAAGCHTQILTHIHTHTYTLLSQMLHRTHMSESFPPSRRNTVCPSTANTTSSLSSLETSSRVTLKHPVWCVSWAVPTWVLRTGEDDAVHFYSLLRGGEVVSAGQ